MNTLLLYTTPVVSSINSKRPYVYFSNVLTKQKYRIYNGVPFGLRGVRGLMSEEKELYYRNLCSVIAVKLSQGWEPSNELIKDDAKPTYKLSYLKGKLIEHIEKTSYSLKHKRTLKWYWSQILEVLGNNLTSEIDTADINSYLLKRYASNNTTYNTVKRNYRCVFNLLVGLGYMDKNPVLGIKNKKAVAIINVAFDDMELRLLFDYLKEHDRILYRVSLLMYTTFLRPHQEIRQLKVKFFQFNEKLLVIPPRFTKNGKQVTIPLQDSVIQEFFYLKELEPDTYIFGKVNPDYFATRWGKKIRGVYPLRTHQTLYSIRHTAAVSLYRKTKDIALIQRLMNHSSIEVTMGYLRSLNCTMNGITADMYPTLL